MFLGVDFGTTNSVCVALEGEGRRTCPIRLDGASHLLPSLCFSLEPASEDAEWVFGSRARDLGLLHGHGLVDDLKSRLPDPSPPTDCHPSWTRGRLLRNFLQSVLQTAFRQVESAKRIVITAPERFDPLHRTMILEAMRAAAGPEIQVELLSEPVAAAVCYAATRERPESVMVFDWGGGTLDVTLVRCSAGSGLVPGPMTELASDGDAQLGGNDIDACLTEYLLEQLEAQLGSSIQDLEGAQRSRLQRELSRHARTLKEQLSVLPEAEVVLPLEWAPRDAVLRIDRKELSRIVAPFLERAMSAVDRCLDRASLASDQIDKVLLVGGSSALFGLSQALTDRFGFNDNVFRDEEPSTAIARGAAIHAAAHRGRGVEVDMIASCDLGVVVASGMFPAFQTLIAAGAPLPFSCTQSFSLSAGQSEVCVPLAVRPPGSKRHRVIDTLYVTTPGAVELPRQVGIQFEIDKQGTLDVRLLARDQILARKALPTEG